MKKESGDPADLIPNQETSGQDTVDEEGKRLFDLASREIENQSIGMQYLLNESDAKPGSPEVKKIIADFRKAVDEIKARYQTQGLDYDRVNGQLQK